MSQQNLYIKTITSGRLLPVQFVRDSQWRAFFGLPSVQVLSASQRLSGEWRVTKPWFHPKDVIGYEPKKKQ